MRVMIADGNLRHDRKQERSDNRDKYMQLRAKCRGEKDSDDEHETHETVK